MAENSVIGAVTVVSGHIHGDGSLEILGRVEGDVTLSGNLVVGKGGRVRGNISAQQLTIFGQVQGNLRGDALVLIESGARVVGDIVSPRIGIAPGALVRGHAQTESEPLPARGGPPPPQPQPPTVIARRPVSPVRAPAPPARVPAPREALPSPLLKAPHKAEPRAIEPARPAIHSAPVGLHEAATMPPTKAEPRRPPPPVVPVIGKGTKAKKRKSHD